MKSINWKKLGIFVLIIIAIIGLIALIIKGIFGNQKVTEEEKEKISEVTLNNVVNLTQGYDSNYDGLEYLFSQDKVTYEDLPNEAILNSAIRYIYLNELDTKLEVGLKENIELNIGYSIDDYQVYKGETIKQAIKELFNKDWKHVDATNEIGFTKKFIYLQGFDVYLVAETEKTIDSKNFNIDYKVIENKKENDTIKTTIAVAYIFYDGTNYQYMNDQYGNDIIYNTKDSIAESEIKEEYIDKFQKYEITLKDNNGKYSFESIEKIK